MDRDKEMGRTVAALRGDRSQQSIADAMRDRGFRWSQATVWGVESGERPLRAAEAEALARVFGVQVNAIFQIPDDAMAAMVAEDLAKAVRQHLLDLLESTERFSSLQAAIPGVMKSGVVERSSPRAASWLRRLEAITMDDLREVVRSVAQGEVDPLAATARLVDDRPRGGETVDGEHPEA